MRCLVLKVHVVKDSLDPAKVAGKIVICNRGGSKDGRVLSRLSKGDAVKFSGGVGMVLINTDKSSENLVSDRHAIPAIHLDEKDGEVLLEWLAEGEGHQAALNDSVLISDEEGSGLMGGFLSERSWYLLSKLYVASYFFCRGFSTCRWFR